MYGNRRSTGQNSTLWLWLALPPLLFNGWGAPKGQCWVSQAGWCGQVPKRSSSSCCKTDTNPGAREPLGLSTGGLANRHKVAPRYPHLPSPVRTCSEPQ